MAKVKIPSLLQDFCGGLAQLELTALNLEELFKKLESSFPKLKEKLYDSEAGLHKFVNLYLNGQVIVFSKSEVIPLKETDILQIVVPIAGG